MTTTIDRHQPTVLSTYSEPRTGPYARPERCPQHPRRAAGCATCQRYQRWTLRRHRLSVSQSEPLTVPVSEVRDHLIKLKEAGMFLREIAQSTGVPLNTISGILYKSNTRYVCRDNARRILTHPVPVKDDSPPKSNLVPAIGTIRRIRALARLGWTFAHINAAGGSSVHKLDQVKDREWVTRRLAAAVKRAYEALSMQQGPSGWTAARAAKKGWPPPLAWDDDTIDDPDAKPNLGDPDERSNDYDPVTVALAVDGRLTHAQLAAHWPDLLETVRRLARRMTDVEIALHLRWPGYDDGPPGKTRGQNNVGQLRLRNGIPGPAKFEAVHAYPTRRPDAKRRRRAEQAA